MLDASSTAPLDSLAEYAPGPYTRYRTVMVPVMPMEKCTEQ
jgi:hypothetical protein